MTLTPRQREVLQLLAEGHCIKRISARLDIAYATTKVHLQAAYRALGAKTGAQAVAIAIRAGVI